MKKFILSAAVFAVSQLASANTCAEQMKIREIHLTEERIEVETKKEGVTFGKIMDCLHVNSERLGDLKFKKPSKAEAAVSFGKGQRVTVSKGEYFPFWWTLSYQHVTENLSGDSELELQLLSHHFTLTRKNRLARSLFVDVMGGLVLTRAHLIEPDTQVDAANDWAPTAGLRMWYQLPRNNEIYLMSDFDRFYTFDTSGDKFVYRGHVRFGWEGQLQTGFSLGAFGGLNTLLEDGAPAEEFGGLAKFTYYNLSLSYRLMYERVKTDDTDVNGFRHTFAFLYQF